MSYEQLLSCALQCARLVSPYLDLERSGCPLVALYLHNGPRLVAGVLGSWLAKGAWTPLDRKSPKGPARPQPS